MKVAAVLSLIKSEAQLSETETQELEKSFFETINLKIVKMLGEELDADQQQRFLLGLKNVTDSKDTEKIVELFKQLGFNQSKAKQYLETAVKQAIREVVDVLGERLPRKNRQEVLLPLNARQP